MPIKGSISLKSSSNSERSFLQEKYSNDVVSFIKEKYDIQNVHCLPRIEKIVVSMRLGKDSSDKKALEAASNELSLITGRKPVFSKARKSISGFKLRQGQIVGVYCTLRGRIAYEFLERLIYIALPRIKDFRGYNSKSFDATYNLTIGIKEHIVFQELTYDKIYKSRGLDICINTSGITSKDMAIDVMRGLLFPIR